MKTETVGMMDARCDKCRKPIRWAGRWVDMPNCPRCGAEPDRVELERGQYEIDQFRELLAEMKQRKPGWPKWARARLAAGLTHGQAARLLGVPIGVMVAITEGSAWPLPWLADAMARLYGVEDRAEFKAEAAR